MSQFVDKLISDNELLREVFEDNFAQAEEFNEQIKKYTNDQIKDIMDEQ